MGNFTGSLFLYAGPAYLSQSHSVANHPGTRVYRPADWSIFVGPSSVPLVYTSFPFSWLDLVLLPCNIIKQGVFL